LDWFNKRRSLKPIRNVPPAEFDELHYRSQNALALAAGLMQQTLRTTRGGSTNHCTGGKGKCGQGFIRQEALARLFIPIVEGVQLPEERVRQLMESIRTEGLRRKREAEARRRSIRRDRDEVARVRNKAYEDKLRGVISEKGWCELERRWSERDDHLRMQMEALESGVGPAEDEAEATFKLLKRAPALYQTRL